ncbi:MAG: hypothetical protein LQ345_003895 [Seirophora villosa]|nr:MAG: hypothetical protein LQ345_003895 [Seirophora villosa]
MSRLPRWLQLAFSLLMLSALLSSAMPHHPPTTRRTSKNLARGLLPRADANHDNGEPFLSEDWAIDLMENHAAYMPVTAAAHDLTAFYTSLQIVALRATAAAVALLQPPPGHYFVHRLGRVLVTFHAVGTTIPIALIVRFAEGMLRFTRMGYTCAYRIRFRHVVYGWSLTVIMSVDEVPPPANPQCAAPVEGEGEFNGSGGSSSGRPVCVLRPPSFPSR